MQGLKHFIKITFKTEGRNEKFDELLKGMETL